MDELIIIACGHVRDSCVCVETASKIGAESASSCQEEYLLFPISRIHPSSPLNTCLDRNPCSCSCSRFSTHSWRSEKFLSPVFRPGNIYCQVPAPTNNDCDCVCQAPGHSPTSPALPGPGCWVTPYPWCIAATPGNNIISSNLDLIKENWTNTQSVRNRIFTMDDLPIKPGYNSDFLFLYSPCSHLIGLFVVDVEVSGLDIDQCDATQSPEVIISSSI